MRKIIQKKHYICWVNLKPMRTIEDLIQEVQSDIDAKKAKMKSDGLNVTFADVYEFAQMKLVFDFLKGKISEHAGGGHVDVFEGAINKMAEIFKLQNDYKEIRFYADRVVYVTYTIEEKTEMEITKYFDRAGLEYRFLPITQIPICEQSTK